EGGASVVFASQDAVQKAVYQFTHPQALASPTGQLPTAHRPGKPKKEHKFAPAVPPASLAVSVLNGTTTAGEAASTATALAVYGYPTSSANADTQSYTQ